jgi:ribosome-associated protein
MSVQIFQLDREYIELNILLKLLGVAPSGGAAKAMVAAGQVSVDGVVESRKTRKLRGGETVATGDDEIRIVASGG